MPTIKRKINFFDTERGAEIEAELKLMMQNSAYNTAASYSPNVVLYPDNSVSFLQKHKAYMMAHPEMDPSSYLSNLRMKTRLRAH